MTPSEILLSHNKQLLHKTLRYIQLNLPEFTYKVVENIYREETVVRLLVNGKVLVESTKTEATPASLLAAYNDMYMNLLCTGLIDKFYKQHENK
jgi:hypothetical protein